MVRYYDSSILLSEILEENPATILATHWDDATIRLSSILLKVECQVGIRRAAHLQGYPADDEWVRVRLDRLKRYTDEVNCKGVDADIETLVRENAALTECRTLDAVHLATALYFQPHQDEPIIIVTLDGRMREVAQRLGFGVAPGAEAPLSL